MVVANAEYAPYLEFGSQRMYGNRRLAPRPFLRPAFKRAQEGFERGIRSLLS